MSTPQATTKTSALFQCAICKEQYSRADHLIRHVRTHTKQRPFVCSVCSKAFTRQDLLKRHSLAHSNTGEFASSTGITVESGRYGPRVRQACRTCALKKLKCTDEKPCRRCLRKNIACEYDQSPESAGHSQSPEPGLPTVEERSNTEIMDPVELTKTPMSQPCEIIAQQSDQESHTVHVTESGDQHTTLQSDTAMDVFQMPPDPMEGISSPTPGTSYDVFGFSFDMPRFGDFIQQDMMQDIVDLDVSLVPDAGFMSTVPPATYNSCDDPPSESPVLGMGTEAYLRSDVRRGWDPETDGRRSEAESLELPTDPQSDGLAELRHRRRLQMKNDALAIGTRDRFLTMVYSKTPKSIWGNMSKTFESLDTLKSLAHVALSDMQDKQMIPFIHVPSLDLNAQRPEFLGALWAYGAVALPSAKMRQFGHGLQELVRRAIHQTLEEECAALRELGMAQAYYVQLYLGFWSAISSKIEVAESSSMLGVTMLRRGKMFQGDKYIAPAAILSMEALSLQQKWSIWIEQESRSRLVHFATQLDAEVSLARNINPLIAFSEVGTPLPSTRRLWEAASAEDWFKILTQDDNIRLNRPLKVSSYLQQPHLLSDYSSAVDTVAAAAALLAACWALVHDYRLMETLQFDAQNRNNFVLNSRYTELISLTDQVCMELADLHCLNPQVVLLQEMILLHLHAAYYQISAFSGRDTPEDMQAAKPYVQWWFRSPRARQALFHAGQIFRHAKTLSSCALIDISVVAIYHATETMLVWGLLQRTERPLNSASLATAPVALDVEETAAVTRYLRSCRGQPSLTSIEGKCISLFEPALVSDLAGDIIKLNWGTTTQPWTTSEVFRLLEGYSNICRQRLRDW